MTRSKEARAAGKRALMFEQPALALEAAGVAGQSTVGADHTVTWDDDRNRIAVVRHAHRPRRLWSADAIGKLPVADDRAGRDTAQLTPNACLELGACDVDLDGPERVETAVEIRSQRSCDASRIVAINEIQRAETSLEPAALLHRCAAA